MIQKELIQRASRADARQHARKLATHAATQAALRDESLEECPQPEFPRLMSVTRIIKKGFETEDKITRRRDALEDSEDRHQAYMARQEAIAANEDVIVIHDIGGTDSVYDINLPNHIQRQPQLTEEAKQKQKLESRKIKAQIVETRRRILEYERQALATETRISKLDNKQTELRRKGRAPGQPMVFNDEEMAQQTTARLVSEYDCLNSQHYVCPSSKQLYQVIDVTYSRDREGNRYLSVARPVNSHEGDAEGADNPILPIAGPGGTLELVNNFNKGKRDFYDQEMPTSDEQWQIAQRADPFTRQIIDKLNETPQSILPMDNRPVGMASTDYLYMQQGRVLPGARAPPAQLLKRRTQRVKETSHERTVIKITQEFVQIVAVFSCMNNQELKYQIRNLKGLIDYKIYI